MCVLTSFKMKKNSTFQLIQIQPTFIVSLRPQRFRDFLRYFPNFGPENVNKGRSKNERKNTKLLKLTICSFGFNLYFFILKLDLHS